MLLRLNRIGGWLCLWLYFVTPTTNVSLLSIAAFAAAARSAGPRPPGKPVLASRFSTSCLELQDILQWQKKGLHWITLTFFWRIEQVKT
jgi:hypothetical protein